MKQATATPVVSVTPTFDVTPLTDAELSALLGRVMSQIHARRKLASGKVDIDVTATPKQAKPRIKSVPAVAVDAPAAAEAAAKREADKAVYKAQKAAYQSANPVAVKKADGTLTHKRFATVADAQAWVASWAGAKASSYTYVDTSSLDFTQSAAA